MANNTDILIIGGGLAGLTLARQIRLALPDSKIVVLERQKFPVQEACHKVGESSVEVGAHYFSHRLQLNDHLVKDQLYKLGLRYFFPSHSKDDIAARYEIGPSVFPTAPSFQLDRGRFENHLAKINQETDITIIDECVVGKAQLAGTDLPSGELHQVFYKHHNEQHMIQTKWVIDASGRFSLLKRKLQLEKPVKHCCHAAWFRLQTDIDIDSWSNNADWKARAPHIPRRFSTNHFMGQGYWVWFIPLASGYTSVGVVIDDNCHQFSDIHDFDKLIHWLEINEPICAQKILEYKHLLSDFKFLKNYAHGCKQVFSSDRWAITGEAGVFADPFYSPGSDLIAMSNDFITQLVCQSLQGEDIKQLAIDYNRLYMQLFYIIINLFENSYPHYGNAALMKQKILWDSAIYLGVTCLLYFNQKLTDLAFIKKISKSMSLYNNLNYRVQQYFKTQPIHSDNKSLDYNFLNLSHTGLFGSDMNKALYDQFDNDDELIQRIEKNISFLKILADKIFINEDIAEAANQPS